MSRSTIAICKFVGSISLGLLTVRHPAPSPFPHLLANPPSIHTHNLNTN